jgi:hypothetical protein
MRAESVEPIQPAILLRTGRRVVVRFGVPSNVSQTLKTRKTVMITPQQLFASGGRIAAALVLSLLGFALLAAAQAPAADVNTVKRIQTVNGVVEIEVHSTREFPIRNQVIVLRIGDREFLRSKTPENGTLKTLIFMLTPEQFGALADGATMTVKFGRDRDGENPQIEAAAVARGLRWDFGKLNKAIHQQ